MTCRCSPICLPFDQALYDRTVALPQLRDNQKKSGRARAASW